MPDAIPVDTTEVSAERHNEWLPTLRANNLACLREGAYIPMTKVGNSCNAIKVAWRRTSGLLQHLALPCQDPMLATLQRSISAEPGASLKRQSEFACCLGSATVRAVVSNVREA